MMKLSYKKPELVAPGGSLEKLKIAAVYGADAVYIGMPGLNLRTRTKDFTEADIAAGAEFLHKDGKKIYVALNIFARNAQLSDVKREVKRVSSLPIDAVIVSDPGVFSVVRDLAPHVPVHISTQANTTNLLSVEFWRKQGAKRIILARELSLGEIEEINREIDSETEVFVHGAMCMSYSGRCSISAHMTNRSANLGDCAHSCRWKYTLREEKRPDEQFPIVEDDNGTYILSSKDLCMIKYVGGLISSGVEAWKIEGRMKSQYYVAAVTRIYREAIDAFDSVVGSGGSLSDFEFRKIWLEELNKVSHRPYSTGFFLDMPEGVEGSGDDESDENCGYVREYRYLGLVEKSMADNMVKVVVKNKIKLGADVEFMGPYLSDDFRQNVMGIFDVNDKSLNEANPGQTVMLKTERAVHDLSIIREKK